MNIDRFIKRFDAMSFGLGVVIAFTGLILFQVASKDRIEINVVKSMEQAHPPKGSTPKPGSNEKRPISQPLGSREPIKREPSGSKELPEPANAKTAEYQIKSSNKSGASWGHPTK